jgi:hypothetical protein
MGLTTQSTVLDQDFNQTSSTQQGPLGNDAQTTDGRRFRYGLSGAVALATGKMNDGPTVVANHVNITGGTAAAVGATSVTVTLGATAATANQYAGGYIWSNSTSTGLGPTYRIRSHNAIASAGTGVFNLDDPIQIAWTTTTKVSLFANSYSGAVITPSAATPGGMAIGVAQTPIAITTYGWFQVGGPSALLCAATVYTLGEEVSQGVSLTAGAGSLKVATHPGYGDALQLGVSGEYQLVNLRLN